MMNGRNISDWDRAEIAKACLPYVHPRIESLRLLDASNEQKSEDLTDPNFQFELARLLNFALATNLSRGKTIPETVKKTIEEVVKAANRASETHTRIAAKG